MAVRTDPGIRQEQEEGLLRLWEAVAAGEFDGILAEHLNYVVGQLPEGYVLDDEARVVRLDPALPDHVHITSQVNGVPSGQVRIPVYTGEPVLSDPHLADSDQDARWVAGTEL